MAPAAPVITAPTVGAVVGNTVSLSGTSEVDGTVKVYAGEDYLTSASASAGTWSAVASVSDGEHDLWATVTASGEDSPASEIVHVTVSGQPDASADSTTSPTAPESADGGEQIDPANQPDQDPEQVNVGGTQIDPASNAADAAAVEPEAQAEPGPPGRPDAPVIEEPHDGATLEQSMVTVSGTAEPAGATVTVWVDSRNAGIASVDAQGDWTLDVSLPNAQYTLSASVADPGGPTSARSEPITVTVAFDPHADHPAPPDDPDERFAAVLRARLLQGYPLRWENITDLRAAAQAWLKDRGI